MCDGIAISWRDLTTEFIEKHELQSRAVTRTPAADVEYRFLCREQSPVLPVWWNGELVLAIWGNRDRTPKLPQVPWCPREELEAGSWLPFAPEPVEVPGGMGVKNGVWFHIRQGVQAVGVKDTRGRRRVYVLTESASHYFTVMTRSDRMPVLIDDRI